jgi:hypothetical protein
VRRARLLLACSLVGACADDGATLPPDPCEVSPVVPGGAGELGLGETFTPVVDGQDVTLELGAQGLWMFIVNTRLPEGDLRAGDLAGVSASATFDSTRETISIDVSCRVRELAPAGTGYLQLDSPYLLPLQASLTPQLEGSHVTIELEVRDAAGRQGRDRRAVVAHLPSAELR